MCKTSAMMPSSNVLKFEGKKSDTNCSELPDSKDKFINPPPPPIFRIPKRNYLNEMFILYFLSFIFIFVYVL